MGWHCLLKKWLEVLRHLANILLEKDDVSVPAGGYLQKDILFKKIKTMIVVNRPWKNRQNIDDQWSKFEFDFEFRAFFGICFIGTTSST